MIKNILWVEDFDNKDSGIDEPDYFQNQIKKQFGEKYSERVDLHRKVYYVDEDNEGNEIVCENLLQYIDDHIMDIDCVVLDINLCNGMPKSVKKFNDMALLFEHGGVVLPKKKGESDYSKDDRGTIEKDAGFYIYLYLVFKGFPCNRIFINTAYAGDANFDKTRELFEKSGIMVPDYISKNDDGEYRCAKKIDEKHLFSDENVYYCVKNIVFSAIDEYGKKLDPVNGDGEDALKAFNRNWKKKITQEQLCDIFENIKRLFYQNKPSNRESVYRTVLKDISVPFESEWKHKKVGDELFTYQRIMKILRNWIAHNKFDPRAKLSDNEFLIFFLLAMRSYFGIEEECFDFEKSAFDLIGHPSVELSKNEKYRRTYLFLSNAGKNANVFYSDYIEFLDTKKGRDEKPICKYSDLLEGLWVWRYGLYIDFIIEKDLESKPTLPLYLKHNNDIKNSSFCDNLMKKIEKILHDLEVFR